MEKGHNSEHIKSSNIRAMLEAIYKYGPISRIEIASILELSPPAITLNIAPLLSLGLLTEKRTEEDAPRTKGRPRILIDFNKEYCYTIGIDAGPYATYACVSDLRGNIVYKTERSVCPKDYDKAILHFTDIVKEAIDATNGLNIIGVSIGIPGFIDSERNLIRYAAVPKWRNKDLGKDLSKMVNLPCIVENNARCRAYSVDMFGKEELPETYAYLFIARGIGCPVKIADSYYCGMHATAGEVGHMVVDRSGPICPTCGNHGCLESISSETAIMNHCRDLLSSGRETLLREHVKDSNNPQMDEILKAQSLGDREVCRIMNESMYYLGLALANIINFLSPPLVLIDAYMTKSEENRNLLMQSARDNLFAIDISDVKIKFIDFDKYRTAIGAAARAIDYFILRKGGESEKV